jgi:hypothetical protein
MLELRPQLIAIDGACAPMATIWLRSTRLPHSFSIEMSTRLPTTCKMARRSGISAVALHWAIQKQKLEFLHPQPAESF